MVHSIILTSFSFFWAMELKPVEVFGTFKFFLIPFIYIYFNLQQQSPIFAFCSNYYEVHPSTAMHNICSCRTCLICLFVSFFLLINFALLLVFVLRCLCICPGCLRYSTQSDKTCFDCWGSSLLFLVSDFYQLTFYWYRVLIISPIVVAFFWSLYSSVPLPLIALRQHFLICSTFSS